MNGAICGFLLKVPLSRNVVSLKWRLSVGMPRFEQILGLGR